MVGPAILARIPFQKVALRLEDLTVLLAERDLVFEDWASAHDHIRHIGYYRFTGYLHPFRIGGNGPDKENYRRGTTFEMVHDRYVFDRKLRMLVLEAVEKIEISIRSAVSNSLAVRHGPHWFADIAHFARPNWFNPRFFDLPAWHAEFLADVQRQIGHNQAHRRSEFIKHYYDTYDAPDMPPCWMIFEAVSFGTVSHCFKFLKHPEYRDACDLFSLNHQILSSWMHSISHVRNICAHHARLWNRPITIKPIIPRALRAEFASNDRVYATLLVMQLMLQKIWSNNHWAERLRDLIGEHPNVPLASMGFPDNWEQRPVWRFTA